ncbi:serine/threonine protein kinase [Lysobacter ciconiae]|uniref:Serine/threonine protein kinase n=1 Tax=Novilysobacter ciconiae TaxID=2781022 RepID=A0A7S6UGC2_9GAMM|nr:serine/threonine protein kinase [Lysobacter ciconiae]QOW19777.1 serine/threonine protein kinase [Lysobacter ciconiae]
MELDDLRQAWHSLDARLQQQNALGTRMLTERSLEKARRHLRPLQWGQVAQMLFGLACLALGVTGWNGYPPQPGTLVAGIVLHAYGVAVMISGGITLGLIGQIDYAAPVLHIQKQLARLRRFYVLSGAVVGLSWWVLWVPAVVLLAALGGQARPAWFYPWEYLSVAAGVVGVIATIWFHRLSRGPGRARLARWMEDSATGHSLRQAQARIDEIASFECP